MSCDGEGDPGMESETPHLLRRCLPAFLRALFDERLPAGVGWAHVLGSTLLALIGVQAFTGGLLAFNYASATDSAWESVRYIEQSIVGGSLIRGLHHWGATAAIVVALLHLMRTFVYAAYRAPRQWTWVLGVSSLLVLLAFGLTGYLLPWDLKAYFGTRVATAIPGSLPMVGPSIERLLRGGSDVGDFTLTRFYALHVIVLPVLLALALILHLRLVRRRGITPPWISVGEPSERGPFFFPHQAWKDSLAIFVAVGLVLVLAMHWGAPLEERADPTNAAYVPRPDWYFLGLQHLLRLFQGPWQILATAILPGAAVALLLFLPWIDRNPHRRPTARPLALALGAVSVALVAGLTVAGHDAVKREEERQAQLVAAATQVQKSSSPALDVNAVEQGRVLYQELRCAVCHEAERDEVAPGLPPDLSYAGSKLQQRWMADYLHDPGPIRWLAEGRRPVLRMPDFGLTRDESVALAAYLASRENPERFREVANVAVLSAVSAREGGQLFIQYQCRGCHVLDGEGNQIGPDLSHVGRRMRASYLLAFLRDPEAIIPGTPMGKIDLWDEEAAAIARFLSERQ